MTNKLSVPLLLFGLLFGLLFAAACTPVPQSAQAGIDAASVTNGADLKILRFGANAADLRSLDPHKATTTNDRAVADMVFNGLMRFEPGNPTQLEPDLALAFPTAEMVDGQQIWTFELRQGVMCHPGPETDAYELTAEDVVYSLQRSADSSRSSYANAYGGMTFEAADEYVVNVIVETPTTDTLLLPVVADYAGGFIVCSKAVEAMGDDAFNTHPVGTGPFMFQEYNPQTNVLLLANPDYFRGAPQLDGVDLLYMPDLNSRELALRAGELDMIFGLQSQDWIDGVSAADGLDVDLFNSGAVATIHFNTKAAPFDDLRVRQAMAYAMDRQFFSDLFGPNIALKTLAPIPAEVIPGGLSNDEVDAMELAYHFDLEKAQSLLAESGYGDGFELTVVTSEMDSYRKVYEGLQGELSNVGIDLQIDIVDHSTMHSMIRQDTNLMTVYFGLGATPDTFLTRFHHSASTVVTGEKPDVNFSHYDQIDALIEGARVETDSDAQAALWKDAQMQILEDVSAYPLMIMSMVYGRTADLDYGHEVLGSLSFYPQITEKTSLGE